MDLKARVKQDAGVVSHGRGRKGVTFGDKRRSKTYVPTGPHKALRVRWLDGKEDTFVEGTTVTFTRHVVERGVSIQSELEALKIADVGDTNVKSLYHFAATCQRMGTLDPSPSTKPLHHFI